MAPLLEYHRRVALRTLSPRNVSVAIAIAISDHGLGSKRQLDLSFRVWNFGSYMPLQSQGQGVGAGTHQRAVIPRGAAGYAPKLVDDDVSIDP